MRFFRRHARIISAILLSELDLTLALFGALLTLPPIGRSGRGDRGSADPTKPSAYDFWPALVPITRPEKFRRNQTTELIVEAPAKSLLMTKKRDDCGE